MAFVLLMMLGAVTLIRLQYVKSHFPGTCQRLAQIAGPGHVARAELVTN